jgi:hypothetical protein
MWMAAHGKVSPSDNGLSIVAPEHYTLLLRSASYFIDGGTRERILEARRLRSSAVTFRPAVACDTCSCKQSVTISPDDILGFIEHDAAGSAGASNVIPFRTAS